MASPVTCGELVELLIGLSVETSEAGEHEAAYHLLMAALHLADHAGDAGVVQRIAHLAARHSDAVEAISPPHSLSQRWAERRGTISVYRTLQVHAHSVLLRIHSKARLNR
jgi:hypothetical protein